VVIRSLTTTGDGTWTRGTGGGITVDSDMTEEYAEATWKAERLIPALEPCAAQPGESLREARSSDCYTYGRRRRLTAAPYLDAPRSSGTARS